MVTICTRAAGFRDTKRVRQLDSPVTLFWGGKATRADLSAVNLNAFPVRLVIIL